jgi:hypothetical protein
VARRPRPRFSATEKTRGGLSTQFSDSVKPELKLYIDPYRHRLTVLTRGIEFPSFDGLDCFLVETVS